MQKFIKQKIKRRNANVKRIHVIAHRIITKPQKVTNLYVNNK